MAALLQLMRQALGLLGSRVVQAGGLGFALGGGDVPFIGGDDGKPKRRRRRRALTASDKADIAFISGTLGKPAGRDFAMIVAART